MNKVDHTETAPLSHRFSPSNLLQFLPALGLYVLSRAVVLVILAIVAHVKKQLILTFLTGWDSHWYLMIAHYGYVSSIPAGPGSAAQCDLGFFPLLPLLIRATHFMTGLNFTASGLLICGIIGAAASVALWKLIDDYFGKAGATKGLAYVLFSPAAVVLSMVYSEGALILFASCALLALRRQRWLVAGLCAAATTALDPVGMAAVGLCFWAAWSAIRKEGNYRALVAAFVAPLGVVSFFTYLWIHTGSFLEWFHAQRAGWQGGKFGTGIYHSIFQTVMHGFANLNPPVKAITLVATIAMLVWAWKRRAPELWAAYFLSTLALGALSPLVGISPRLLLRSFPLLAFTGATLPRRRYQLVGFVLVVSSVILAILSTSGTWIP